MKHAAITTLIVLGATCCLYSCQKAPELTLTSPASVELSVDGGSGTISFTANRDWKVSCSDSWVSVSPSSGTAANGTIAVTVRCEANTTYDDRSATVTISMEGLTQSVTVRQPANSGVLVPKTTFDLTSGSQTIEVEVQKNVNYTVEIEESCKSWIKKIGTKGLTSEKITFEIAENTSYDSRKGKITIIPFTGPEQTIIVNQAAKEDIVISQTTFNVPFGGGDIEVKLQANVFFDVKPGTDWIHFVQTKGLSSSTVVLSVDENTTYSEREGTVDFLQNNGALTRSITVKQAGRVAVESISLNRTGLALFPGETFTLNAIISPENATDKTILWSTSDANIATVDDDGKVTAVKEGTANITAKAGEKISSCKVTVQKRITVENAVDLGVMITREDGSSYRLLWAECNLGAEKPEDSGGYYAWGETETKSNYLWSNYKFCSNYSNPYGSIWIVQFSKYNSDPSCGPVDNKTILEPEDDAAHMILGGTWRMPTKEEFEALIQQCTENLITKNGVKCLEFKSKFNSNSIILPASAGYRDNLGLSQTTGPCAFYWSSTRVPGKNMEIGAWIIETSSVYTLGKNQGARYVGYSIRPVTE